MQLFFTISTSGLLLLIQLASGSRANQEDSPWILSLESNTSGLPPGFDDKFMATLGNGQLAVTPYLTSDSSMEPSIYMNCLYNGRSWTSHRARIPNYANYLPVFNDSSENVKTRFSLNLRKAEFEIEYNLTNFMVTHQVIVHRKFTNVLLNVFTAENKQITGDSLQIKIDLDEGSTSNDITSTDILEMVLEDNKLGIQKLLYRCEETLEVEFEEYQNNPSPVCIAWTEPIDIIVNGNDVSKTTKVFVTIVDKSLNEIEKVLYEDDVLNYSADELLEQHYSAWETIWSEGNVQVHGDLELERVVLASQYYLLSSLPASGEDSDQQFCGLSPGSLAYGDLARDYQGHSFWDTATWMYPPVLVVHPSMARSLLVYRWSRLAAAMDYAASTGWAGARFPWESAWTGGEVCPDFAADVRDYQHHVTGDISFAIRQYLAMTGDVQMFQDIQDGFSGCQFVRQIAEFWSSRISYNAATGKYDINEVMGPDEYHANIDNNVYTNIVAAMAIFFSDFTSCVAQCPEIPEDWIEMASQLSLQYDSELDYHPQYEGYQPGTTIKQADTVLAGFPLMYNMTRSSREQDLRMYESVTDPGGPAMTWGMFAVGYLELGQEDRAAELFRRSYEPYYHQPFYMWTENVKGTGAVNFITGMGGFLQGVIFGYFGARIKLDRIEFAPVLPVNTSTITLTGLDYFGAVIDISVDQDKVIVDFRSVNPDNFLVLTSEDDELEIGKPQRITISRGKFNIRPLYVEYLARCKLPSDSIGN